MYAFTTTDALLEKVVGLVLTHAQQVHTEHPKRVGLQGEVAGPVLAEILIANFGSGDDERPLLHLDLGHIVLPLHKTQHHLVRVRRVVPARSGKILVHQAPVGADGLQLVLQPAVFRHERPVEPVRHVQEMVKGRRRSASASAPRLHWGGLRSGGEVCRTLSLDLTELLI